jgi:hypothetical protein
VIVGCLIFFYNCLCLCDCVIVERYPLPERRACPSVFPTHRYTNERRLSLERRDTEVKDALYCVITFIDVSLAAAVW